MNETKITEAFNRVVKPLNSVKPVKNPKNDAKPVIFKVKKKPNTKSKSNPKIIKPKSQYQLQSKPRIPNSIFLNKNPILVPDFYQIDALDLAPRLLGKYLRRDDVVLQITEVEAYRSNDSACHGRFGITSRTAPVFGPGGHAYVYLCYGLHTMLNVVADKEGIGSAVLIRSCSPVSGLETIKQRRGLETDKPVLLAGPGKVGQALGISKDWSNHKLFCPGGLELLDGPEPQGVVIGPRVGIEYALPEHVSALWRFAIAGCPWVYQKKKKCDSHGDARGEVDLVEESAGKRLVVEDLPGEREMVESKSEEWIGDNGRVWIQWFSRFDGDGDSTPIEGRRKQLAISQFKPSIFKSQA